MRLHTILILAFVVVGAHTATIPTHAVKKLPTENEDVLIDNNTSEQEIAEKESSVKDNENALRNEVEDIPVQILEEIKPVVKAVEGQGGLDDISLDDEPVPEIKREEVDLNTPGEPQRQEHDSQSPESNNVEQETVKVIKLGLKTAQTSFNEGLESINKKIKNFLVNEENISNIQDSIQKLEDNFADQFRKINNSIQEFWKPEEVKSVKSEVEASEVIESPVKEVDEKLKILDESFQFGVKSLSEGVEILGILKEEETSESTTTSSASGSYGSTTVAPVTGSGGGPFGGFGSGISSMFTQFQNQIAHGFQNIQNAIQNAMNQTQANGTNSASGPGSIIQNFGQGWQSLIGQQNNSGNQSAAGSSGSTEADEQNSTTAKPTLWNQFQTIWNRPGQAEGQQTINQSQNGSGSRPIVQAIQNNPIVQGFVNLVQRPTAATTVKPAESTEGANVVPASSTESEIQKQQAETATIAQPYRPIQQIIQRNPIVQSISGAVQRIIGNPEKPRDNEATEAPDRGYKPGYGGNAATGTDHSSDDRDSKEKITSTQDKEDQKKEESVEETQKEKVEELQKKVK